MNRIAAAVLGLTLLTTPVAAFDIGSMSNDERQVFRDEIRAYLLDNPEVLMEAIGVLESRQAEAQVSDDSLFVTTNAEALFNEPSSYVGGNLDGDITLVEFVDYKCGYCKRAHPEVAELLRSDGNIRYILKEFPILGAQSVLASQFAISVLQNTDSETYAAVHDALMTFRGDVDMVSLKRLAHAHKLDADVILKGMNSPEVEAVIAKNHALGQAMKINGTPSFVMGDQMLRGYVPLDGMRQIVAELRKTATN